MKTLPIISKFLPWIVGGVIIIPSLLFNMWDTVCILLYGVVAIITTSLLLMNIHSSTKTEKKAALVLALLFSIFITFGRSYLLKDDTSLLFASNRLIICWIIQMISFCSAGYFLLSGIIHKINALNISGQNTRLNLLHWFLLGVFVKVLFLAAHYPCIFDFDAAVSLRTFLDPDCAICSHHPVFIQGILAFFFSLGKAIGHRSFGMVILSLISIILTTCITNYGLSLLVKNGIKKKWILALALFFTFFPIYPYLSIYTTKDGFFAYSFLFYLFTIYELVSCYRSHLKLGKWWIVLHGTAFLLVCLTRNQGIYLVIPSLIVLAIALRQEIIRIFKASLPALLGYFLFVKVLLPFCDVEPGGKQEAFGMFFQQTAYYLVKHPTDITPTEKESIDQILDYNTLTSRYSDYRTDPVKNKYSYNPSYRVTHKSLSRFKFVNHESENEALKDYFSAWLSMGLRHPLTYLEASVRIFLGFFYNFENPVIDTYTLWNSNKKATTPEYSFWHFTKVSDYYFNWKIRLTQIPIISLFFSIPYYIWLTLLLSAIIIIRKDFLGLTLFTPIILSLFILLLCPIVDGRYVFPIVISLPLLLFYLLVQNDTHDKTDHRLSMSQN